MGYEPVFMGVWDSYAQRSLPCVVRGGIQVSICSLIGGHYGVQFLCMKFALQKRIGSGQRLLRKSPRLFQFGHLIGIIVWTKW